MVEITNFDWGLMAEPFWVSMSIALVAFVSVLVAGFFLVEFREKKVGERTATKQLLMVATVYTGFLTVALISISTLPGKEDFNDIEEEVEETYDVILYKDGENGIKKFDTSDWDDEMWSFSDDTKHRKYVLVREEEEGPDVEAVLLFERDNTDSDDFTVSLAVSQKGDKDAEFLDYNTGEPIDEKTNNAEGKETD